LGEIIYGNLIGKQALETGSGDLRRQEIADLELDLYFSDLNISHTLVIRPKISSPYSPSADDHDPPPPTPTSAVEERIKESMRFSANMPMLSRQGFIDLSALEYLRDPEAGHRHLKHGVEVLGIWKELGIPMPRSVLPEMSIPKVLRNELDDVREEKEGHWTGDEEDEERTSPIKFKFKGGEAKVGALMKGEEFEGMEEKEKPAIIDREQLQDRPAKESKIQFELGSPIVFKGGEAKVEALLKGEKFENLDIMEEEEKQMKIDSVISSLIPKVSAEKESGEREESHSGIYTAD
jgi:hypothetical protein